MSPTDAHSAEALRAQAAGWFARVHSGEATHGEIDACAAWRRAHPSHDEAYRRVEYLWQATRQLPQKELRSMLAASRAASGGAQPSRRRYFGWAATAVACALVGVTVAAVPLLTAEAPSYQAAYVTQPGERREVTLPDGSVINLNVNTHVEVAFFKGRREVSLTGGQAFFAVQHETQRRFVVRAPAVTVTVTGTRFDVRSEDSRVAVESGSVQVTSGAWWNRAERRLVAGQAVDIDAAGALSAVMPVHIENLLAWRQGKIVFRNAPLTQVVAEMNRYLEYPATLQAPALRDYRVAGVFNIDEPQAILAALPAVAPVQVRMQPDGSAVIVPR
ncbi:FecR family protein [Bordetella genomosp. 12]|uniref:Iron dicitrate transport regulator FecR n=1 Tax=Bordetella genomosp. 12 TaxID=463035 RepID=A0A261V9V1_9BORD|nr:FecR family protein [Bordetella genomosp. 12]OZI70936.1 hypothetical protein CAL22_13640 [Bordetella genomosp. 12]